ncbi:hypothetical protein TNCV_4018101 [Trichonephila clavipes]|nr:hypothetical protein TNCV_4018101 [Trichonephila clavipes]
MLKMEVNKEKIRFVLQFFFDIGENASQVAIDQKWSELANRRDVVFHQDKARPHTSELTRQKLWELGWKVLNESTI